jgi:hypothetical protein
MISANRLQRIVLSFLAFAILIYLGDYAILKLRASSGDGSSAFGSIRITLGTPMKDGRVQIFTGDNQTETCVHSIFPHLGYRPCWYVKQNQMQIIGAQLRTSHPVPDRPLRATRPTPRVGQTLLSACLSSVPRLAAPRP